MVVSSFIVDQVLFGAVFLVLGLLYGLQLVVERKAIYDQNQLNERQRVHRIISNQRRSLGRSPGDRAAARTEQAGPSGKDSASADDEHSTDFTEGDSAEQQHAFKKQPGTPLPPRDRKESTQAASKDPKDMTQKAKEKKKGPVKVGPLQKVFHRLGFLGCLLMNIRTIDPYGALGLFDYQALCFLYFNAAGIVFLIMLFGYFYPIHLINVVALKRSTGWLDWIGMAIGFQAIAVLNIIPALFSAFGPTNFLRALMYTWMATCLVVMLIVYNFFMWKLTIAINELIAYHIRMDANRTVNAPPTGRTFTSLVPMVPLGRSSSDPAVDKTVVDSVSEHGPSPPPHRPPEPFLLTVTVDSPTDQRNGPSPRDAQSPDALLTPSAHGSSSSHPPSPAVAPLIRTTTESDNNLNAQSLPEPSSIVVPASTASPDHLPARRYSNPAIRQYRRMMRKMHIFQAISSMVVIAVAVTLYAWSPRLYRHGEELGFAADPDDFWSGSGFFNFNILLALALANFLWYSSMPIRVLWQNHQE